MGSPSRAGRLASSFTGMKIPDYLKDNEFIVTGYRADIGVWGSLKSLFRVHNESGNVWTHLIGAQILTPLTSRIYTFVLFLGHAHACVVHRLVAAQPQCSPCTSQASLKSSLGCSR